MNKSLLSFIILIFIGLGSFAQNFSNKGKEFFLCFPNHVHNSPTNQATLSIFITNDRASSGTITMANGFFSSTFNLTAANGFFQEIQIQPGATTPSVAQIFSTESNVVGQKSIRVVVNAGQPAVVVYAQQWAGARTAATLVLPTNVLGKKYLTSNYTQTGGSNGTGHVAKSQFQVIATKPNTTVQVTPRFNGILQPVFTIILPNIGDIYQYQPATLTDITGTSIESIATGTSGCLPIAVFSGSSNVTIGGPSCTGGSSDPLWQQMYPTTSLGKNYGFIPFALYGFGNFYRVTATQANTQVFANNILVATLANAGDIYPNTFTSNPALTSVPTLITADKPISVAHYSQSQICAGGQTNLGDPDMVMLNSIEQNIEDITVFSSNTQNITNKFINILIPTNGVASFRLSKNGGPLITATGTWQIFAPLPGYSYIKESIETATTRVRILSDSGFNAIAYGFGQAESYAYSAGTFVKDLITSYGTQSQFGIESGAVCTNSPFKFKISLPFQPDSIYWNLSGIVNTPQYGIEKRLPITPATTLVPDSTTIVNGTNVYWYSLPNFYSFNNVGISTVPVTLFSANSDGCGNVQDKSFDLDVSAPPLADFTFTQPGCPTQPVTFTDATISAKPNYIWNWNFGDPTTGVLNTSTAENPTHIFSGPGTFSVTMSTITTAGCFGTANTKFVTVPNLVTATISGTTALCQNAPAPNITFTTTGGLPPFSFTYNVNGGTAQTITTTGTNTSVTLVAPTNNVGTFAYNLTRVDNANASFCNNAVINQTATITINPLPTATIAGAANVCQNATSPIITFTGANATAAYTFTYNINGLPNQTITTTAGNSVTLNAPTNVVGIFNYNLVSVVDASGTLCSNSSSGSVIVQVQATSTATITGGTSVCQSATAPIITFTANNGVAPFTFTYNINGGATQTVVAPSSNTVTVPVSMATSGTFIYNLLSVQNTGVTTCITNFTNANTTVVINPVPTATIAGTTTVCQVAGPQTITFTGVGGTANYTFVYAINGVTQPSVTSVGNTATVVAPVTTTGTFIYTLLSVRDASSTTCIRNYTAPNQPTATVIVQATSTATISGSTTVCQDAIAPLITFTAANGTAPMEFTYTLITNGVTGAPVTVSSTSPSLIRTIPVPMGTTGTLIYTLISVKNTGTINCTTPIVGQTATVVINPVPTATIIGTTTVCQNATMPFVTFTGAGGTGASYTFNYTLNGIAQPPITGNNINVNQPTGTASVYTYIITSVKDASTPCVRNYSAPNQPFAIITVKQLATAIIATNAATVCQNSIVLPVVTFTASGGVAPYTFTYNINGGANATITTTVGNSVTLNVPTTTANTFNYNLVSVRESSPGGLCINAQTGTAQIIVHPQPTASFTTSPPYCAFNAVSFTPAGTISSGTITSWVWNYGDGMGANVRPNQNPFTITYNTAGTKNVTYKTISNFGCESILFAQNVIINSKPKAGFKSPESCLADAFAQFIDTSTVVGGTIVNWEWDFGDGSPIISGGGPTFQNPLHAYATVGLKTVRLIVTTNSGCKDTVLAQSFFINGEVTSADFITQNPTTLCSNRPVRIRENSVVVVGGLIRVEIYWDNSNAPTVIETDELPTPGKIYTHNYPNLQVDRTYNVRYVAYTGFDGTCQKETIKPIIVRASPVATFTTPVDVCLNGGTVVLNTGTANGGTGVYSGPGVTFSGGVYTFNPLATGVTVGNTNNVTYAVTSPAGCDSALIRPIRVLAPPVVNSFTTLGNLCRINNITFTNSTTNGSGTIVKWIYDWGDGSPIQTQTTGANVTHQYTTAGIKTVTLTLETDYGCRNIPVPLTFTVNALPVPTYTFTNSACLPAANIVFTNTMANQSNFNYQWSFELPSTSPANTSVLPNPSHIYTTLGPHNTQLVAINNTTGCKDSTAIIVINSSTIHPAPVVQFNAIPNVCLNNGTVIINQASETSGIPLNGGAVYSGPGITLVAGNYIFNPLASGVVVGLNTISVTFTSTFNCPTTRTQTVRVLAAPVVNTFITVGNKCERNLTEFNNTITQGAGNITEWIYDWGDGSPIQTVTNGNNVTHQYATANTYAATLRVRTSDGCFSLLKPLSVVVNALPLPNFRYSDTVCLPAGKVFFTNTSANLSSNTYNWVFNNIPPTINTSVNTDFTYSNIGPHPVTLIATNALTFCKDSITKNVTTIHPAPTANFDFSVPSVCIGSPVRVIDRSTFADGTSKTWEWNYGDGALATGQTPAPHTYATAQDFNVTLKVTNSFGCFDDTMRTFTVHPFPVVNAGRDSVILQGGQIVLTPIVTGNDLAYLWTGTPAPINLSSTTIKNPIASPLEDITYKLRVTARGGCFREDFVFIKVLKAPVIPNTFTPNRADSRHTYWEILYLSSYPNNKVQVFTRAGQLVFESKGYLTPWDGNNMSGQSLPFDTYYYIIEPGSGRQPLKGYVTIVK